MSDGKKREIKIEIIDFLKKISTTINEENEIKSISKDWDIEITQEKRVESEEISNGVFLF
jgi:predicted GIY-YIG superfamily endonuclease